MGVLSDTYNTTFICKRITTSSSTSQDTPTQVSTGNCVIRPISQVSQLLDTTRIGKEFKMWTDETNIAAGDILTIDSVDYNVSGVSTFEDLAGDFETHLEVRIYRS